ncbi:transcription elongation complex subunit [Cordyceps militaris CM01]|uniref:FACT complex subunit n=2 Tax=Cordyceps militaris TaxID=73501 RepID=G3JNP4_CORMM|nr:transcription elongation complex subunit [Cordyceps militaris CM01]ATY64834.1 transcription elongation complex subunit [Cordyceps militaris]EGX89884.1 transcription elongation complex subunit [Cordyceps militaris CM01]
MAEIKIDSRLFQERINSFVTSWKNDLRAKDGGLFQGATSLVVLMGKVEEIPEFHKNNAMHFWLLGYEFPTTLMLFTTETLYILTTPKKAKHLEQLKGGRFPIEVLSKGKDADANTKLWKTITDKINEAGNKVGTIARDTSKGPFIDEWKKVLAESCKDVEQIDASVALSTYAFSVKDENELRAMRTASKACVALMTPYFLDEMSNILDAEKKVKHSALADKVDKKLDDDKFWKTVQLPNNTKLPADLDATQLDWILGPAIQSGGKFDLRFATDSNDDNLHPGIIVAAMGLRYKSYCSSIARTYLVDPNKSQENNYKLLCQIHNTVIQELRDGVIAKDVYAKALSIIKSKSPEMEKHFLKNVGWGVGLENRDSTLVLNAKNQRALKDGMTLIINTGFQDIDNPQPQDKSSKTYSLVLNDTVRVRSAEPIVFTAEAPTTADANSFFFKDDEEEQPTPKKEKRDSRVGAVATKNITSTRLRSERSNQVDTDAEAKRRAHQKDLATKKQKEGLVRFSEAKSDKNGDEVKKFKRFESYKRDDQFPLRVKNMEIIVDTKNATVVLPIMGRPVPFHINTIKNASKSDENDFSFLRVNFLSPGQGVGRKDDQPFEDANAHFVRSLTFRSTDGDRYSEIATQISNLKRDAVKKEQEKKDMEDVVEQDKLTEIRNRRPAVLDNVYIRPAMEGKRVPGKVEIHQNGIRYLSPLNAQHRVDILFSNVKHLFFQPCQHELIVIIHIHLKDPIIVGNKKKTRDVQFYREATDIQFDETGNRKRKYRYGDEDEFEAEQEERRRRAELDRLFQGFAQKIAEAGRNEGIEVDMPIRDLGFHGVPFKSNVFIQPTTDCLIQVIEPPFMVVTIEDIEIAHLERVQFGLKNFDMVFVFKDFSRSVTAINTIPVEFLDQVKDFLDSSDIAYSEGPLNLNWPTIMKTVTADTHQFFVDGGWSFLQAASDDEGEEESEEESAFEVEEDDLEAASESSEDDSEYGSNASDDDDGDAELDSDDEGEDWDELEKKAKKRDRESGLEEEERVTSKKRRK